jgi:hypothetical protein
MRVLTRRRALPLFLAIAILSLLLFAFTIRYQAFLRITDGLELSAQAGEVRLFHWDTSFYRINYEPGVSIEEIPLPLRWLPSLHLGGPPAGYFLPGEHEYLVSIPLWIAFLASALAWFAARRAGWQHTPGHCHACGYDLQGLPTPRCPECGRAAS